MHQEWLNAEPPAGGNGATGDGVIWPGALSTQDPVPRRHDAHRDVAAGSDGTPGRVDSASAHASDEVSRRVRATQPYAGEGGIGYLPRLPLARARERHHEATAEELLDW
jgi:hypothetical protein